MRFWYWGVAYTEALDYLNQEDIKTVIAFFRAWEAVAPYQRGENVAPAGLVDWTDLYTLQEAKIEKEYHARWRNILEYLSFSFRPQFLTIPEEPQMVYWRFKHGPVAEPVEDSGVAVDHNHDAEDFDARPPMVDDDYYFHVPVPSAKIKDPMEGRTDVLDPEHRCPQLPGDVIELVTIPYAIHKSPGLCSRAASCYVVIREDPYEDIDWDTFWLHTHHIIRDSDPKWCYIRGGEANDRTEQNNHRRVLDFVILQEVARFAFIQVLT